MEKIPASQATTILTTIVGMTLTLVFIGILSIIVMLGSRWEKQLRQEVRIQVYFQRDLDPTVLKSALTTVIYLLPFVPSLAKHQREKLSPHPHVRFAFGLKNSKPFPFNPPLYLSSVPIKYR